MKSYLTVIFISPGTFDSNVRTSHEMLRSSDASTLNVILTTLAVISSFPVDLKMNYVSLQNSLQYRRLVIHCWLEVSRNYKIYLEHTMLARNPIWYLNLPFEPLFASCHWIAQLTSCCL